MTSQVSKEAGGCPPPPPFIEITWWRRPWCIGLLGQDQLSMGVDTERLPCPGDPLRYAFVTEPSTFHGLSPKRVSRSNEISDG